MKKILALCLGLTLAGCSSGAKPSTATATPHSTPTPTQSAQLPQVPGVISVTKVQRTEMGLKLLTVSLGGELAGTQRTGKVEADPDRRIVISPQVAGTIKHLPITVGSKVRAGDVIAILDSPEITILKSDYRTAEVEVDLASKELVNKRQLVTSADEIRRGEEEARIELSQARAARDASQARLESARLTHERLVKLEAEGIASAQQLEQAFAERKVLEADLREAQNVIEIAEQHLKREQSVARQQLRQKAETFPAEASLARANESVKHLQERILQLGADPAQVEGALTLVAPIDGQVIERPAARGQLVSAGETVAALVDPSEVWAWVDLTRADLAFIQVGTAVSVALATDSKAVVTGEISHIDAQMAAESQTIRARISLRDTSGKFRVGSFVTATFATDASNLPTLPQAAIQEIEGQTVVYVADGENFRRMPVTLVASTDSTAVVSGLKAGSQVVVHGASDLKALELSAGLGEGE